MKEKPTWKPVGLSAKKWRNAGQVKVNLVNPHAQPFKPHSRETEPGNAVEGTRRCVTGIEPVPRKIAASIRDIRAHTTGRPPIKMLLSQTDSKIAKEALQAVSRRAFELYEKRGKKEGYALEDWVRAESEILCKVPAGFLTSDDGLVLYLGVAGVGRDNLEVCVEPRRVTICGKRATGTIRHVRFSGEPSLRKNYLLDTLTLPMEVDQACASAQLSNGTLELKFSKAAEVARPTPMLKAA
jgi:HSP20 family protein